MSETNNYDYKLYLKEFIKRERYFEIISPFVNKDVIKVITGQRRVGKSYMLYQLMVHIAGQFPDEKIIYINKEFSGDIAGHLSGRYIEFRIYSLSYTEFLLFHKREDSPESLHKYMAFGGLPYLIHLDLIPETIYEYLKIVYANVLFKDVVRRYQIRNVYFLEDLVKFLGNNVGSLVSANSVSKYLKSQQVNMSAQIVLNYLSNLTAAMLILKISRQDIFGKKVFETNEKYYFEDWGLRNSLTGYNVADTGKILENMVLLHILILGFRVRVGVSGETEIDFVCTRHDKTMYVQVAYLLADEKTVEREFGNLLRIKDNYPKYVVSMDEVTGSNYKGIEHLNVRDFLKKDW